MIFLRRFCVTQIRVKRCCSSDSIMRPLVKNTIPTLYGDEASPPVRFVMMTASLLGIKLKFHEIDLFTGQNMSDFYTKINPLQKVPALDTGERVLSDSHAIALYLCRGTPRQGLYPEDVLLRAKVDEMLFFNSSSLFPIDSSIFSNYFSGKTISSSQVEHWDKLMDYLDLQLKSHSWLAGDKMTLCDLCCGSTVTSLQLLLPPSSRHVEVAKWIKKLGQGSFFDINSRGLKRLAEFVDKVERS